MRPTALAALLLLAPVPALADSAISDEIAASGLGATEARLAALSSPTDAERFALGGVRFLRTLEEALQIQASEGLYDPIGLVPFLRLVEPVEGPTGSLRPEAVAEIFTGVATGMQAAREPLAGIGAGADFGLEIDLSDIWFDVNGDGVRMDGEGAMDVLGPMLFDWRWSERDPATPAPVIRFDAADAAWLSAYTHLLGGTAEAILAYDPTDSLRAVVEANAAMADFGQPEPDPDGIKEFVAPVVDLIAVIQHALLQQPDAARLSTARDHFLAMIADNRRFWDLVDKEADNDREWLPNDRQQSALGFEVPQGTGQVWLGILDEAEAILRGERLVPYWRTGPGVGVNVARVFTEPRPIDLVGWIQGMDALPYLERGTVADWQAWSELAGMMSGDAMLMALYLN